MPDGAKGKPIGADRARSRPDAPPRTPRPAEPRPPRPDLPVDDRPNLPKVVRKDIERTLGPGRRAHEVALALSVGSQAIDEDRLDVALPALAWAKDQAPRVPTIREAYGVARYLDGDFAGALTELQTYARVTGRTDQQHLIADCLRALDRGLERVEEALRPLLDDPDAPLDRRVEGAIVLAAARADAGDLAAGRQVLDEALADTAGRPEEHHLRARVLAADLAERDGDLDLAIRHLQTALALDPDDGLELRGRLERLEATRGR